MFGEVDRTLRSLLARAVGLAEEQVRFERPDARFAESLGSSEALDLYLHDVRENRELRRADVTIERRGDGTAELRPPALRFDLSYLVTAWAGSAEREHELLGRALEVLLGHPTLEPELLQGSLREQGVAIPTAVLRPDALGDPGTLWGGLGGVRPAIFYSVTVPVSPYPAEERRLVASRLVRVGEKAPGEAALAAGRRPDEALALAGQVLSAKDGRPLLDAQVSLREISRATGVDSRGVYRIEPLAPGRYTLVVSAPGHKEARREVALTDRAGRGDPKGGFDFRLEPA